MGTMIWAARGTGWVAGAAEWHAHKHADLGCGPAEPDDPTHRAAGKRRDSRGPTQRAPEERQGPTQSGGLTERAPGSNTERARRAEQRSPRWRAPDPDTESDTETVGARHRERESTGPRHSASDRAPRPDTDNVLEASCFYGELYLS